MRSALEPVGALPALTSPPEDPTGLRDSGKVTPAGEGKLSNQAAASGEPGLHREQGHAQRAGGGGVTRGVVLSATRGSRASLEVGLAML